ncbi:uncharacterized protein TNCV_3575601 [Trichonephila clavipes]|nr:uncharacterized protein TNCV_3575601 [Trichonephila clavipes]
MCTNYSSESASPSHILECPRLPKQDLADVPLLVLVGLSESVRCHGPGLVLLTNEGVQQQQCFSALSAFNCVVACAHGDTLNSRQAASPLVWLVVGEERWVASDHTQSVLPLNWGGIEPNRTVTRMVLNATANDRRHLALCHDEFRGP